MSTQNEYQHDLEQRNRASNNNSHSTKSPAQLDPAINRHCRVAGKEEVVGDFVGHQQGRKSRVEPQHPHRSRQWRHPLTQLPQTKQHQQAQKWTDRTTEYRRCEQPTRHQVDQHRTDDQQPRSQPAVTTQRLVPTGRPLVNPITHGQRPGRRVKRRGVDCDVSSSQQRLRHQPKTDAERHDNRTRTSLGHTRTPCAQFACHLPHHQLTSTPKPRQSNRIGRLEPIPATAVEARRRIDCNCRLPDMGNAK